MTDALEKAKRDERNAKRREAYRAKVADEMAGEIAEIVESARRHSAQSAIQLAAGRSRLRRSIAERAVYEAAVAGRL